ncbi:GntR family transcriptional regulator [Sphingomonas sp. UYP23]
MNSGATAERIYDSIKRALLEHEFRPGDRLDPALLADTLSSSVTPVREALNLLTGEGLIDTRKGDGFHVPGIDEPGACDLYDYNEQLLVLALRCWPKLVPSPTGLTIPDTGPVDRTTFLFAHIARRSGNAEHASAIQSVSDRLTAMRHIEVGLLANIDEELAAIADCLQRDDRSGLRRVLAAYHRRRRRVAAAIVRGLYRSR